MAREIVRTAVERVARRLWPYERVRERFCARSADEVLRDGDIHYGTPCADLCTVAGEMLLAAGFEPVLVLCRIRRLFQPVKFQCGIELEVNGASYYVGFSETTSRLAPGRFEPTRSRTAVHRARPSRPGLPHLAQFGVAPATVDALVAGHDLERHLRWYRRGCSSRAFERTRSRALDKWTAAGPQEGLVSAGRWVGPGEIPTA